MNNQLIYIDIPNASYCEMMKIHVEPFSEKN